MLEMTGYQPVTTFWIDFSIADLFGKDAIRETYNRVMEQWKNNYIYLTELIMILNWKSWYWSGAGNDAYTDLYIELYEQADEYAMENLAESELTYFLRTVD